MLKSLIASKLVYFPSPLPTNHRKLKELSGKGDKIKQNVMIGDYSDGGLKMIDLESYNKALKSTWVKKYLDPENHGKWKYFFDSELQLFGGPAIFSHPQTGRLAKIRLLRSLHYGNLANLVRSKN